VALSTAILSSGVLSRTHLTPAVDVLAAGAIYETAIAPAIVLD